MALFMNARTHVKVYQMRMNREEVNPATYHRLFRFNKVLWSDVDEIRKEEKYFQKKEKKFQIIKIAILKYLCTLAMNTLRSPLDR